MRSAVDSAESILGFLFIGLIRLFLFSDNYNSLSIKSSKNKITIKNFNK